MKTFEELGISSDILKAILELGFEAPMPVQEKVIPFMLEQNKDIVALAQTGTGKTAAFGLPIIQQVDVDRKEIQALVLCPTRELCMQITGDLNDYAKYIDGLKILPVYGGSSIETQITALKKGVQIVVATPGRLIDLIKRRAAKLGAVKKVVLDEADEMLNMGFLDSINEILAVVPEGRTTLLFSATMPDEIARISKKYMTNPIEITIGHKNEGAENVKHICYTVHAKDKYQVLKRIADFNPSIYGIVFCRTRKDTQEVADKLMQDGYNADSLHGDLSQAQRDMVMQKFRVRNISLLVATDVAARGLDVDDLTHIINYSLPDDYEVYTHRSGRTGRAGKAGTSVAIINLREKGVIRQIEKKINKQFTHAKVPGGREICEKQLFHMIDKMEKVEIDHSEINKYLPVIYRKLEWLDKEEIIQRFVSLEFNRFLDYYSHAKDISTPDEGSYKDDGGSRRDGRRRGEREGERSNDRGRDRGREPSDRRRNQKTDEGYTRMFINVGKLDGLNPGGLIELINKSMPGKRIPVGRIDLLPKFSFFEVESGFSKMILEDMKEANYNGTPVAIDIAQEKREEGEEKYKHTERKKSFSGDKPFERKPFDKKPFERKSFEKKPFERSKRRKDSGPKRFNS
jgi:ATP-dependent RNA helicase DeaD